MKDEDLYTKLAQKAVQMAGPSVSELERCCWRVVHEYRYGFMPSEYDIRDIDEVLFLKVLNLAKSQL